MPNSIPRAYYPRTTFPQRRLMIETHKETKKINLACRRAHVHYQTFTLWYSRYQERGEEGIRQSPPREPWHHPRTTPEPIVWRIVELHQEYPRWGKRSIADQVCKEHGWQHPEGTRISPNGVRKVLEREGLWHKLAKPPAKKKAMAVHADEPRKTCNVDLFLLPAKNLPPLPEANQEPSPHSRDVSPTPKEGISFAGQAFFQPELILKHVQDDDQMNQYLTSRQSQKELITQDSPATSEAKEKLRQARAELRTDLEQLRIRRRKQRQKRSHRDQRWKILRQARREEKEAFKKLSRKQKRASRPLKETRDQDWQMKKEQRREELKQRKQDDKLWHQELNQIRERQNKFSGLPLLVTAWVAVLLIIDNCTRKILSLPLFTVGKGVSAHLVVEAMRQVLPSSLRYLITDNGPQFISELMAQLASQANFIHVRIKPKRARTNGIAERAIRTVKELLLQFSWGNPEELYILLSEILEFYNDRPHQGAELNGLSPNEYERRLLEKIAV